MSNIYSINSGHLLVEQAVVGGLKQDVFVLDEGPVSVRGAHNLMRVQAMLRAGRDLYDLHDLTCSYYGGFRDRCGHKK